MQWCPLVAFLFIIGVYDDASASRILFISAISGKSQKGFFTALVNKLADNGHQVTIVSPLSPSAVRENVREIVLDGLDVVKIFPNLFVANPIEAPKSLLGSSPTLCSDALERKEVQDLLHEKFDVGMISLFLSDCFLSVFHRMKIPYIQVFPAGLFGPMGAAMGNPSFPSFVTFPFTRSFHPFSFPQRIMNTLLDTIGTLVFDYVVVPNMDSECRQRGLCPAEMPSLSELKHNSSLLFVNSVRTMEYPPRPVVPSIIHVGGIHCREARPLPKDLEEWISGAGDEGFIFFSLGSIVTPSSMPQGYRKVLLEVFGSLKQRILFKWDEETMEDLPPNVKLGKWFPQQDILGDPRLRIFLTHGGALSTQESIYHRTPVIGLPVFADQMTNMLEVQQQGWGRVLEWDKLTPEILRNTIYSVMQDEKLKAEVNRRSALMRDQITDAGIAVNYWTEYVIRHNGAHHLKSPFLSMSWYQVYNVDVWLTVLAIFLVVAFLSFKLAWALGRSLFSSRTKYKVE